VLNEGAARLKAILKKAKFADLPLIFVIPGSGQIARCAIEGGAQFLMVLNVGLYRTAGVSPLGSYLPFGNANDQTEALLRNQIIPRARGVPIVAGILACDPTMPLGKRLHRLQQLGVGGIANWPFAGLVEGRLGETFAQEGFNFKSERQMLIEAKEKGFATFGFTAFPEDSAAMADSGVDALVLNLGWTHETHDILEKGDRIQQAVASVNAMLEAVGTTGKAPICLFFGGSITSPEDTAELYRRTGVVGFGGGSAFERIPVVKLITNTVKKFCSVPLKASAPFDEGLGEMVGVSSHMLKVYDMVRKVAPFDVNICIEGESGVGKELVATQLHRLSQRASLPFITLNCGAIPDSLVESELFGHERGAFTGAVSRRLGKFELADSGTLFLDEVAELSSKAQVSLLRAIQQKEISRVGGEAKIPVDVRIISATLQDLGALVKEGKFRTDLFYRLNTIILRIPPLRARKQDIPALVSRLLNDLGAQFGRRVLGVTPDFMGRLMEHSWPGNVRELRHVLCRSLLLEDDSILQGDDFIPEPPLHNSVQELQEPSELSSATDAQSEDLINALEISGGNKSKAARILGISRKTLYSRLKKIAAPKKGISVGY
jgi:DNA-binding NtrC family response regulator/predicted TIM-barrel enzyme